MKYFCLTFAALLIGQSAFAADCVDPQTQQEMNACAAQEYQKADGQLNATYQQMLTRASEKQRELLTVAQRAWLQVRDADCKFVSSGAEGGSAQSLAWNQCLADKTRDRNAFLTSLSQCDEGDLSCPLPPSGN
ncbi:lysozyme inhibitor LprI family protein [Apirhabdus apintestini]|uniref:lysozyme inhibitor LprI family protein n=1 Tax=Erwinia sp. HR93 TaxID=3094840 RepID=UPI002ADEC607|nr:lysozyme inhibitor LprI family protein [Erwinia sp. HR93]MEA1064787.1 lysozyme inhibitor LprI family protein [Erwinia sp. HR93]WPM85883.1 lysozyme inhibitor LprI family protein [Enterobacteriaceae bacterium CA-0114]